MPQLVLSSSPASLLFRPHGPLVLRSQSTHLACPANAVFRSPRQSPGIGQLVKPTPGPALLVGGNNFLARIAPLRVLQGSLQSPPRPFTARSSGHGQISMAAVPETMKAWQYAKYGGGADSLELVDKPVPKPGPNEILLKVSACEDWLLGVHACSRSML